MEISAKEDHMFFIWGSKKNIDDYITKKDFSAAFSSLILVLEKLDNDEKIDFIGYYRKRMITFGIFASVVEPNK